MLDRYTGFVGTYFTDEYKYSTWRELWYLLADAQMKLGVNRITPEAVQALKDHVQISPQSIAEAAELEKSTHHDVVAHIRQLSRECPEADGVIHLGATSSFVTDNADIIAMRRAMAIILGTCDALVAFISKCALRYDTAVCVGYTHLQRAQPLTMGKRMTVWAYNLTECTRRIERGMETWTMLGCKGATGTYQSFVAVFMAYGMDERQAVMAARSMDRGICRCFDMLPCDTATQTYDRVNDCVIIGYLADICCELAKIANDIRFLQSTGELREATTDGQAGSSTMAYKKNPIQCEKICSLARVVCANEAAARQTACAQVLERTLDDSACRRVYIPDSFIATDHMVNTMISVISRLRVDLGTCERILNEHQPNWEKELVMVENVTAGSKREVEYEVMRTSDLKSSRKRTTDCFEESCSYITQTVVDELAEGRCWRD